MSDRSRHDQVASSIRQAAKRFGIGEGTLRRMVKNGYVPISKPPGSWPIVFFADVERYLRSLAVAPTEHAKARVAEILAQTAERKRAKRKEV